MENCVPRASLFSIWCGFYHSLIYAKQNIFPFKPKYCKWERGMQNMMCSSYPGHSCFIFDLYQQPFPGREEEEKYFQNYSPVVNQHIPRLGFLLWAERGAALGAGMGPQSAPSSPLPIPETTQPCSHQSFPPLFPNRAGFLGLGARGLWDGGCS